MGLPRRTTIYYSNEGVERLPNTPPLHKSNKCVPSGPNTPPALKRCLITFKKKFSLSVFQKIGYWYFLKNPLTWYLESDSFHSLFWFCLGRQACLQDKDFIKEHCYSCFSRYLSGLSIVMLFIFGWLITLYKYSANPSKSAPWAVFE